MSLRRACKSGEKRTASSSRVNCSDITSNGIGPCSTSAVESRFASSRYHWRRFLDMLEVRALDGVVGRAGGSAATSREEDGEVGGSLIPADSRFLICSRRMPTCVLALDREGRTVDSSSDSTDWVSRLGCCKPTGAETVSARLFAPDLGSSRRAGLEVFAPVRFGC